MATVYITEHIFKGLRVLSGLKLLVQYDGKQAEVLIQGLEPAAALEENQAIRDEIRHLGEAIIQAGQSPQGIIAGQVPPP
jgi:hypothetical protein